ncbi:VOC family protein [Paenibacillus silvisoli]|uniref:VOC family protein n=1 Tax=Paenibacillus silvisoli TaxID=3110539 RepID=UPI002805A3FF|nr:VOC family protein [Paenibacillus silvisoli]
MEQAIKKPAITGIDGVYIPVANRKQAEQWYIEHLGLEYGGDYLLAGKQEVFLRERLDERALFFRTNEWLTSGDSYEMPVICFRTSNIDGLYEHAHSNGIRAEDMITHSWFKEFDLYDPDGNKLKVWQPNE